MKWSGGLFSRRTEINGFRLQVLRTQGLQASINATASISSNLDKAFPFNTNHGKPLISVLLLNKPRVPDASGIRGSVACATESRCAPKKKELKCVQFYGATTGNRAEKHNQGIGEQRNRECA